MIASSEIQKIYAQRLHKHTRIMSTKNILDSSTVFAKTKSLTLIALLITISIVCRIVYLNTLNNNFLAKQLNVRIARTIKIPSMRGTITDRNGNALAVSTKVSSLWADPTQLDNLSEKQIENTAKILKMSVSELNKKLNQKNKTFVYIKRAVTPLQASQVLNLDIGGIYNLQEYKRFYPYTNVTAHVVGFSNIDDNGTEGIEYANNNSLKGHDGQEKILRDRQGDVVQRLGIISPSQNGNNTILSIDSKIQYIAYNALKKQVEDSKAKGGAALVLDAKTGEILAMVNMPTYNPNNKATITKEAVRNKAAIDIYEPGSIIKPIVISKALDEHIVKPWTTFSTTPYHIGNKLIKDDHPYPSMNVAEIIQHSSDVGASKIALKLNKQDMWQYYSDIGFGSKVGTGFPGEASGIFRDWKKWHPIDQAEMGFGYGISVSLTQMARSYSLFTNDGCLLPLSFYKTTKMPACRQLISSETAKIMRGILAQTTTRGTGKLAQTDDYTTAGKTGTAHKYKLGGYAKNEYYGSFVGFAPANKPKIIIAVTIDNPKRGSYYGSAIAAPVFAAIAQPALHELEIAPDKALKNINETR